VWTHRTAFTADQAFNWSSARGRSKSLTVNYEIRISYFVTFQHRHLQLKCTWSSVSPMLWYHRIVVPGLPASLLPCNTNTNGEYRGWRSSSKPAF